jgi:hypothetical protein
MPGRPGLGLLALGLIIPVAAGAVALLHGFDGLYGQDPFAYFEYATGPMRESLLALQAPPPFFWPPGYPLAVAVASLVVGPEPLAGQIVSLLAGALVPIFTWLLAREIWPARGDGRAVLSLHVPLIAGLLVAFTGQLWQSSVVVMADTLGIACATAGVWALARYGRRGHLSWLLLAAALLAGATLTRWIYGVVGVPCVVYALHAAFRQSGHRVALWHAGAAVGVVAAILAPVLAGAASDVLRQNAGLAPFAGNFQVYRWSPLGPFQREFLSVADGRLIYGQPTGLYYALAPARWAFFTPILAPLILPGAWAVYRRRAAAPALLLLGWAVSVYVFHAGAGYQNFRFTLAYLPPLAILAAIGAQQVTDILGRGRRTVVVAACAFGACLTLMAAAGVHTTRTLIANRDRDIQVVRWAEARTPDDATIVTFGLTSTFRRYSGRPALELYDQDSARLAALLDLGGPVFLLVAPAHLEGQWAQESPGRNVRWLECGPGVARVGSMHDYTLFRVGETAAGTGPARRGASPCASA